MAALWTLISKTSPFLVGSGLVATIWKRQKDLWGFYYESLEKAIEHSRHGMIDRKGWEEIAKQNSSLLIQKYSAFLLRIEIEYLRHVIKKSPWKFWRSDSSTGVYSKIENDLSKIWVHTKEIITDREASAETIQQNIYLKLFRFLSVGLLAKSIWYWRFGKRNPGMESEESSSVVHPYHDYGAEDPEKTGQ
jgi:hypothetical protein